MKNFKIKILTLGMLAIVAISSTPVFAKTNTNTESVIANSDTKASNIPSTTKSASTIVASFICNNSTYSVNSTDYIGYGYQISGTNVKVLQAALNSAGYNAGHANGHFGHKTLSALEAFQLKNFGYTDKVAGPKTWRTLAQACDNKVLAITI